MKKSYTSHYFRIYLWQALSIVLNFMSMLVVVPRISSMPEIFGVYSVCISVSIFLSYADLGFLSAAGKYSSECFARGERDDEIKIVGFVWFVLTAVVVLFSLAVAYVAYHPEYLIKNIAVGEQRQTATGLLMTLALFSPVMVYQRLLQMVFGIRLLDFMYQRIFIAGNVLKIVSVFYFFSGQRYDVVGYYFFCQFIVLLSCVAASFLASNRFGYDFVLLLKSFRFSKAVYRKTKKLAYGSLYITVAWILFYELDALVIARLLGSEAVAVFAVGMTMLFFLRSLFSTLYAPFYPRINHLVGIKNAAGVQSLYRSIITLTLPIVVFPILSAVMLMKPLVFTWVGNGYESSVVIAQLLLFSAIYAFISYPSSISIIAHERIRTLYFTATIMPLVYWLGIALTIWAWGVHSFAVFKCVAFTAAAIVYFVLSVRFMRAGFWQFLHRMLWPAILPSLFIVATLSLLNPFMPLSKGAGNVLTVVFTGAVVSLASVIIYYFFCSSFHCYTNRVVRDALVAWRTRRIACA